MYTEFYVHLLDENLCSNCVHLHQQWHSNKNDNNKWWIYWTQAKERNNNNNVTKNPNGKLYDCLKFAAYLCADSKQQMTSDRKITFFLCTKLPIFYPIDTTLFASCQTKFTMKNIAKHSASNAFRTEDDFCKQTENYILRNTIARDNDFVAVAEIDLYISIIGFYLWQLH